MLFKRPRYDQIRKKYLRRMVIFAWTLVCFYSCTSHPLMLPEPLKKGASFNAFLLSSENGFPQYVYRRGLSDRTDIGFRIGLPPTQGDGIDMSYKLIQIENRVHSVNLSAGFGADQNNNLSLTYLNAKKKPRKDKVREGRKLFYKVSKTQFNYSYFGVRYMLIPKGIGGDRSQRVGMLYGLNFDHRWGTEIGYFHDFAGGEKLTALGRPSEHAAITGLSVRFWMGGLQKK